MHDLLRWITKTGLENIVWITDVDETLLEKSGNPNDVTRVPDLEAICERLDRAAGGGFFVITGRDLDWLDKVFPKQNIRASCEYHSLFRKEPGKAPEILNPVPQWDMIDADLDAIAAGHPGLLLRKKTFMRSLHYVAVPESERAAMKAAVEPLLTALMARHNAATGHSVAMVDGGKVFDMGPGQSDKSHALCDIMALAGNKAGKSLVPVYFGDSPGDLPAANAAKANGGIFVAVGGDSRIAPVADFRLTDPAACRMLIKTVLGGTPTLARVLTGPGLP